MQIDVILNRIKELSKNSEGKNKELLKLLNRKTSNVIDDLFHRAHQEVFETVDCLDCANCCKSISPIVTDKDIEKIARKFKLKPSEIVEKYLRIDEDNDYVFRQTPCPFLLGNNYCNIYDERPKACKEYPHTDRKKMQQIFDLTLRNSKVCPAVYLMFENLKERNR